METKTFMGMWYVRALLVLVLFGVIMALSAYTTNTLKMAQYSTMGPTTITVQGEGEVQATPDIGEFSFSVRAEGEDAETAQTKSAEAINAILAFLEGSDVEDKDIKTQNYNLNPKYRYEREVCESGTYCPPGEAIIDGYEVSQMVSVKVRDLDKSGDLISGVGSLGATNISSLQFTIDDESVLKAQARKIAIVDAQNKAKKLASDLSVRIVRMTGFYEDEGSFPPMYYAKSEMAMDSAMGGAVAPSIPTGENTINSTVSITYEIK